MKSQAQVHFGRAEGKIYTIIEASVNDKQQCEAIKSLIRQELGTIYEWLDPNSPEIGSFMNESKK